jgi:predicted lipid-binding transport protein (Tim44 family)
MFFDHSTRLIGSRGSRRTAGVRATPAAPNLPEYAEAAPREAAPVAPPGLPTRLLAAVRSFFRPLAAPTAVPRHAAALPARATTRKRAVPEAHLERGLSDIARTDPGFDPSRFTGYAGMTFRATQRAWTTRDFSAVRDRLTPELYAALQAHGDRLRETRRVNHIEDIDVVAMVTEAWQESGRDYVTAHITGSTIDYTIDEGSGAVVEGSKTVPRAVEEFWTFTRLAGLNSWMLSAIQA